MNYTSEHLRSPHIVSDSDAMASILSCNWQALRKQLMLQWPQITDNDLDMTGPNCHRIATLIEEKYGVSYALVENYLRNFERTMPLQ